jgi:hypothetical protein
MTCSAHFRQLPNTAGAMRYAQRFIQIPVTVLEDQPSHRRGRRAQSPPHSSNYQSGQSFQAVPLAQTAGRRVEAGAGATAVFVAMIRHDPSLARLASLVGRSRTCPSDLMASHNATRWPLDPTSKE